MCLDDYKLPDDLEQQELTLSRLDYVKE